MVGFFAAVTRLALVCMLFIVFVLPQGIFSAPTDVLGDPCSNPDVAAQSPTCKARTKDNPLTGTSGTLYKVSMILSVIAGIVAVVMIIVSGLRYITSSGDAQKTASAKNTLIGAIIGLVVIVLAQATIILVIKSIG